MGGSRFPFSGMGRIEVVFLRSVQHIPEKGSQHERSGWAPSMGTHLELEHVVNPGRYVTGCLCAEDTPVKAVKEGSEL